jgi:hypothetical protein
VGVDVTLGAAVGAGGVPPTGVDVGVIVTPGTGITKTCPTRINAGFEIPLALANSPTLTPYCSAISDRVSPFSTVWVCKEIGVGVRVEVARTVFVGNGVLLGVRDGVEDGLAAVGWDVAVGSGAVGIGVLVGMDVAVAMVVLVGIGVGEAMGVSVAVGVRLGVAVGVGV